MRREIKLTYYQKQAFFGDQDYIVENGKQRREKYGRGIYDLEINDLFETRPSLKVGDKIIARQHSALEVVYEGDIISINDKNLICVQFKDDFVKTFDYKAYVVEFDFSRLTWIRQHFAIDMAISTFGLDILDPKEICSREKPLLDVRLSSKGRIKKRVDRTELKWHNKSLNEEQKQTVVNILRGDMLNPHIIYGPPGKKFQDFR